MTDKRYTSRKFWTMVGSVTLFTALLTLDQIPPEIYQTLMFLSVGGYLGSNCAQKFAEKR